MTPIRLRRSLLKDSIVRALLAAGGEIGSVRLRMTVEQSSKAIPDATWYAALNRLADEKLISEPIGRKATAADVRAILDTLTDLSSPVKNAERGTVALTRTGRLYALALHLASMVKPSARQQAEHDLNQVLAAAAGA